MSVLFTTKNPKLLISKLFDSLINHVDIYTEEQLAFFDSNSFKSVKTYENDDNDEMNIEQFDVVKTYSRMRSKEFAEYVDSIINTETIEDYFDCDGKTKMWNLDMGFFDYSKNLSKNRKPKTMNVCDYWNATRDKLLKVLDQFQKDSFERYEQIKHELKRESNDIESIMGRIFENSFVFILKVQEIDLEDYIIREDIHLIELDFYLNYYECQLLR